MYGKYDLATDVLKDIGFTYYDSSLPSTACSCTNAVISGTPVLQNTSVTVTGQSVLKVNTLGLSDTVSQFVGITQAISNFCGQYRFVLSSPIAIAPALVPDMLTLCNSDCGYYDNYTLATLHPMKNDLLGFVPFTLSTGLATFTIPVFYATTFDV